MKSLIEILENNNLEKQIENGNIYFTVSSLTEYLNIIKLLKSETRGAFLGEEELIFRGESDFNYNLIPSILRVKEEEKVYNLLTYEKHMIKSFQKLVPNEFNEYESTIDLLSKMQHYGLPTRLLDFTFNPLIALYFSVIDSPNKDAKIYVLSHRVELEEKYNFIFDETFESFDGQVHLCNLSDKYFHSLLMDLEYGGLFSSKIYHPKYISQREINQSAVFLVPNYKVSRLEITEEGEQYIDLNEKDIKYLSDMQENIRDIKSDYVLNYSELNCKLNDGNSLVLKIPNDLKKNILYELSILNITDDFVFPELNNISKKITNKYLNVLRRNDDSMQKFIDNVSTASKCLSDANKSLKIKNEKE